MGWDTWWATRRDCLWGNPGILCLFSGSGQPLARFHPDNVSQGGAAINWKGDGNELIFLCSTREAFVMYDGYGRKVVVFPVGEEPPAGDYYGQWEGQAMNVNVVGDARDEVVVVRDGVLDIYTQDTPYPRGEKIYAPVRKGHLSSPNWEINGR